MKIFGFVFVFLSVFLFFIGMSFFSGFLVYYIEFVLLKVYGLDITLSFWLDWMSLFYVSVIIYITGAVYIFSDVYLEEEKSKQFGVLLFFFVLSMVILVLSGDYFMMFLGWDGLGVTSFLLVVFYQNYRSLNCGMITFVSNRIGDVFMMFVVGFFLFAGSWNFFMMFGDGFMTFFLLLFFLASITKSAQFPFSAWLPAAMAAPTPVSALVHSSTLVTAGVYLLCRLSYCGFFSYSGFLIFLSLLTLFFSSLMACLEFDVKKVIALSTLSQLGLMVFSISLGLWKMGYYHMIMHAMFKSMLFLCGGSLIFFLLHNQDMRFYSIGLGSSFVVKVGFCVSLLSLCGFPFLSGFYSKDFIVEMFMQGKLSLIVMILFLFSMILTVVYSMRLLFFCYGVVFSFPSFCGFFESKLMDVSIIFLMFWSVVGGKLLFGVLFNYSELVFLGGLKLVGIYLVIFGFSLFFLVKGYFSWIWGEFFYLFADYFYLFGLSLNSNLKSFYYFDRYFYFDKVWTEQVGPVGLYNLFWLLSYHMNKFIDIILVFIFILFFLLLLL